MAVVRGILYNYLSYGLPTSNKSTLLVLRRESCGLLYPTEFELTMPRGKIGTSGALPAPAGEGGAGTQPFTHFMLS